MTSIDLGRYSITYMEYVQSGKRVFMHVVDNETAVSLCGVSPKSGWCIGGEADYPTCARCRKSLDKMGVPRPAWAIR